MTDLKYFLYKDRILKVFYEDESVYYCESVRGFSKLSKDSIFGLAHRRHYEASVTAYRGAIGALFGEGIVPYKVRNTKKNFYEEFKNMLPITIIIESLHESLEQVSRNKRWMLVRAQNNEYYVLADDGDYFKFEEA